MVIALNDSEITEGVANEYLYPLIMSGVIFVAVAVDSGRSLLLTRLTRRPIRMEEP